MTLSRKLSEADICAEGATKKADAIASIPKTDLKPNAETLKSLHGESLRGEGMTLSKKLSEADNRAEGATKKADAIASAFLVRVTGVEPARLSAREPKSRMSANSIIPADILLNKAAIKKTYCRSNRFFVERLTRLELATSTLARWRSTG